TIKGSIHSTGAMYSTVINNPRAVRFLGEETFLICVIPGPHEPSLEQINHVFEPFIREVNTLYCAKLSIAPCVEMDVASFETKQPVHATILMNNSDLPASRKTAGLAGHTSE
ncbi:hypothetical protein JB92DRAFT_2556387, partial [Gautieria morchelliformis]